MTDESDWMNGHDDTDGHNDDELIEDDECDTTAGYGARKIKSGNEHGR